MSGNKNKIGIWAVIATGVVLLVAVVVGQQVNQPNDQVVNEPPVTEQPMPDPAWFAELASPPAGWRWYKNAEFEFAFQYPEEWEANEKGLWRGEKYRVNFRVDLEPITILVFPKPDDIESWLLNTNSSEYVTGEINPNRDQAVVNGRSGYMWPTHEQGYTESGSLVIVVGDNYLYQLGFLNKRPEVLSIVRLIESFTINGQTGATSLPFDPAKVSLGDDDGGVTLDQECCSDEPPDQWANSYSCSECSDRGNCTWKCEEQRSGDDNFRFRGPGTGRDAYKWMSRQWNDGSFDYAQGGTVPRVGAVLVAMKNFGDGLGHVATITGINSDGSIQVTEQNCYISCTRTRSYGPDWFADNLAGYIYPSEQLPFMTPKQLLTVGETIIDDYNRGRAEYNFATKGPGSPLPENDNELAWGFDKACGVGFNCYFHYMLSSDSVQGRRNGGRWFAWVIEPGLYELEAWIPDTSLAQATVHYVVGGLRSSHVKQADHRDSWAQVRNPDHRDGYWGFSQTGEVRVRLPDFLAIERNRWIVLDAIRFTRRG